MAIRWSSCQFALGFPTVVPTDILAFGYLGWPAWSADMHSIRIDRGKRLGHEPHLGHNRFHPDIAPIVEVGEGEEVALETRDALDGQIKPGTTVADFPSLDAGAIHPLTGPVFVKGAAPGDILEIEFTDIIAQPAAFSAIIPGLGFLRDVMTEPFLVHWQIRDSWATSA